MRLQFGAIKGIRLNLDDRGECKGYAFVEFEDEVSGLSVSLVNVSLIWVVCRHRRKQVSLSTTTSSRSAACLSPLLSLVPLEL